MDIRKLSIRDRVLVLTSAAVLSLIALSAAFSLTGSLTKRLQALQVDYNSRADVSRQLETELLRLEMHASRFLADRDVVELEYFEQGVPGFRQLIESAESAGQVQDLTSLAERYITQSEAAFEARDLLGLDENDGLEGALRKAVHDIERRLQVLDDESLTVLMLMMRRHEKDFMMRLDTSYIDLLDQRADTFRSELARAALSADERREIESLLQNYQIGFTAWSHGRLDLMDRQQMAREAHSVLSSALGALSNSLLRQADMATQRQRDVIDETTASIWISVALLIALCGGISVLVARSIVRPIAAVSDEMLSLSTQYETNIPRPLQQGARNELERMRHVMSYFADNLAEAERLNREVRFHRDNLAIEVERQTAQLQQQKLQLQLSLDQERELNHLQTQFVATVSHEFRTPLTIIDGTARRISRSLEKLAPDAVRERLGTIRSSVRRLSDMVEETLDSSRASEGQIDINVACVDLVAFVQGVVDRHREIAPGFDFEYEIDEMPDCIQADPRHMDHIFSNLISNAIKYSQLRPHVILSFRSDEEFTYVAIRDHGVGIPEAELPKISSRFFRASTSAGIKGTGIGLNLVAQLVEAHEGEFSVDSEEGSWTEVSVKLPIRSPIPSKCESVSCEKLVSAA